MLWLAAEGLLRLLSFDAPQKACVLFVLYRFAHLVEFVLDRLSSSRIIETRSRPPRLTRLNLRFANFRPRLLTKKKTPPHPSILTPWLLGSQILKALSKAPTAHPPSSQPRTISERTSYAS